MRRIILACCATSLVAACTSGEEQLPEAEEETTQIAVEDALVPGTDYHATAPVQCGFDDAEPTQTCNAGVIRDWGEDGTTLVEVTKPDGSKRAIFFNGLEAYGADSAEADGSAGWDFVSTTDDEGFVTIEFGPESYVIVDAFVEGG